MTVQIYTSQDVDLILAPLVEEIANHNARIQSLESGGVIGGNLPPIDAKPDVYDSQGLNWASMAIGGPSQSLWYCARRAVVVDVKAGDILLVTGRGQVTNNTGWVVEVAELLTVTSETLGSHYPTDLPTTYGVNQQAVQPIIGRNVTPDVHYLNWHMHEVVKVVADAPVLNVSVWLRARSSAANGNNGNLIINMNQARMHVMHWG